MFLGSESSLLRFRLLGIMGNHHIYVLLRVYECLYVSIFFYTHTAPRQSKAMTVNKFDFQYTYIYI